MKLTDCATLLHLAKVDPSHLMVGESIRLESTDVPILVHDTAQAVCERYEKMTASLRIRDAEVETLKQQLTDTNAQLLVLQAERNNSSYFKRHYEYGWGAMGLLMLYVAFRFGVLYQKHFRRTNGRMS